MSDQAETPPPAYEPNEIRIKQTERGLEVQTTDGFSFLGDAGTDFICPNGMNFIIEESDVEPYHIVRGQVDRLFELTETLLTEYGSLVADVDMHLDDQENLQRHMSVQSARIQMLEAQKLRLEKIKKERTGFCSFKGVLCLMFALFILAAISQSEDGLKGPSVRKH